MKAIHRKTGNEYTIHKLVTDTTNASCNREMVLYSRNGTFFVREILEFCQKFKLEFKDE